MKLPRAATRAISAITSLIANYFPKAYRCRRSRMEAVETYLDIRFHNVLGYIATGSLPRRKTWSSCLPLSSVPKTPIGWSIPYLDSIQHIRYRLARGGTCAIQSAHSDNVLVRGRLRRIVHYFLAFSRDSRTLTRGRGGKSYPARICGRRQG